VWGDVRTMYGLSAELTRRANQPPAVTRSGPRSALHPSLEENLY
jgi:hypothetical protein